jgi:hypothetical protein
MKQYFTKTGIELKVIQGGSGIVQTTVESIADIPLSELDVASGLTSDREPGKRFVVGFDATSHMWFVDDRYTNATASKEYSDYFECQIAVDDLNAYDSKHG